MTINGYIKSDFYTKSQVHFYIKVLQFKPILIILRVLPKMYSYSCSIIKKQDPLNLSPLKNVKTTVVSLLFSIQL